MIGIGIGINRRPLGPPSDADILTRIYEARVIADGGVIESVSCVKNAFGEYSFKSQYQTRVALDGGVTESVNCFYRVLQDLYLMN